MQIREYPVVTEFSPSDVLLLDKEVGGTKIIKARDLLNAEGNILSTEMRRMTYRGENLGSAVTSAQKQAIQDGSFEGLFLGDYWEINDVKWIIADFDYWFNCEDVAFTDHHLVIVPEKSLYNAQMNTTNITTGGYVGSVMKTTNLTSARTRVQNAFGSMLKTHREYLINAVTNGYPSGGLWVDSVVDLMTEPMVYGGYIFTPGSTGAVTPSRYTTSKTQLALFAVNPKMINIRENYWLRDVVSAAGFACVGYFGYATGNGASYSYGVRPAFAIG